MKRIALLIAAISPLLAHAEVSCDSDCSRCLPQAEKWARQFADSSGWGCEGKPLVLSDFHTPAPNAIDYSFRVECTRKVYISYVPMNRACDYTGE